uniref:Serpentine receptor class gamma n=1 Tax=Caenorhabditis tropicalis TaxID=1561998 RepID=A0A1I7UCN5_9PELO
MNIFSIENVEVYDLQVNKWMIVTISLIASMLISSLLISLYFSVRLLRTLRLKRLMISARSFRGHQIAVTSLMAQATIPFIVIVIPIGTIVYFLFILFRMRKVTFQNKL